MLAAHGEPVGGVPVFVAQLGLERRLPPQLPDQPMLAGGGGQVECRLAACVGAIDVEVGVGEQQYERLVRVRIRVRIRVRGRVRVRVRVGVRGE